MTPDSTLDNDGAAGRETSIVRARSYTWIMEEQSRRTVVDGRTVNVRYRLSLVA
jgi:hypothetical protein